MTNEDLLKIEARNSRSLDVAALSAEIRTAWRVMDQLVQTRIDQDAVVDGLNARVRELERGRAA